MDAAAPSSHTHLPFPVARSCEFMLKLAELLCLAGIYVTFLVSCNTHNRLLRHTNVVQRFSKYHGFHLDHHPYGYDENKIHTPEEIMDLHIGLQSVMKPFLKEFLSKDPVGGSGKNRPPFTSIIADGILSVALDFAEEIGMPVIYFRTTSADSFWPYFCTPLLTEAGNDMDLPIAHVKGMEGVLRHRDLPSFYRANDLNSPRFKLLLNETLQTPRAKGLILNTFEDLEGPILSHV